MVPNTFLDERILANGNLSFTNERIANEAYVDNELYSTLWEALEDTEDDTNVNLIIAYFKVDQSNEKTIESSDFE